MKFLVFLFCTLFSLSAFGQLKDTSRQELQFVNLLGDYNPGFENALAKWSKTGSSTLTKETTNVYAGTTAAIWNASATGEYLTSRAVTIPDGLKGRACMSGMQYKWTSGTAGHIKLQAYDGTNVLAEKELNPADYWLKDYVAFTCPTSGTIQFRLESTADAEAITIDNVWLGEQNNLVDVSQAELVASAYYASGIANCQWPNSGTTLDAFSADTDCAAITVEHSSYTVDTTKVNLPQIVFPMLPPGRYSVVWTGALQTQSAAASSLAINDGTDTRGRINVTQTAGFNEPTVIANFEYTTSGARTFKLYGAASTGNIYIAHEFGQSNWTVYRYPLSSEKAVSLDTQGAIWSGYHGQDCAWYVTNTSYADPAIDASCTFSETRNNNFGTVISHNDGTLNNNYPGLKWTPKKTGNYMICTTLVLSGQTNGEYPSYKLLHGATTIYESGGRVASNVQYPAGSCGFLEITNLTEQTIKFQMKETTSGFAQIGTSGPRSTIEWSIVPVTQNFPQAVVLPPMKWQQKFLQSDLTAGTNLYADTVDANFKFTTEIGKTYRVTLQSYCIDNSSTDTIYMQIVDGTTANILAKTAPTAGSGTFAGGLISTTSVLYKAVTTTLRFYQTSAGTLKYNGDGSANETWAIVEELPYHTQTTGL